MPLTNREVKDCEDDLTVDQFNLLQEVLEDKEEDEDSEIFHPNVHNLRDLRLWLNDGVRENSAHDEAEAKADRQDRLLGYSD